MMAVLFFYLFCLFFCLLHQKEVATLSSSRRWLVIVSRHFMICSVMFFWVSCEDKYTPPYEEVIIVEGSIDEGGHPLVILGKAIPINTNKDNIDLSDYPVLGAKVVVNDGERDYILAGKYDGRYFPPFIYNTPHLVGEVGKTYTLTVQYGDKVLTSETTIPSCIPLDDIHVSRCPDNDTLYQIKAFFKDPKNEKNYYKIFTQVMNKESCFYSSFLGVIDDSALGDSTGIPIHRGMRFTDKGEFTPYYTYEDVVQIKFAQISKQAFDFWSAYENEVNFSSNLFFPVLKSLPSNIKGGKGIWCGYGAYFATVSIARDLSE